MYGLIRKTSREVKRDTYILILKTYIQKLLDSDILRAVQFKLTPVQKSVTPDVNYTS